MTSPFLVPVLELLCPGWRATFRSVLFLLRSCIILADRPLLALISHASCLYMISQGLCASLYTHLYYSAYKAHLLEGLHNGHTCL